MANVEGFRERFVHEIAAGELRVGGRVTLRSEGVLDPVPVGGTRAEYETFSLPGGQYFYDRSGDYSSGWVQDAVAAELARRQAIPPAMAGTICRSAGFGLVFEPGAKLPECLAPRPQGLSDLLGVFRYKPGWSFTLAARSPAQGWADWLLLILTRVQDVYHPEQWQTVATHARVPAELDDVDAGRRAEMWMYFLRRQIEAADDHELGEWFVVDGARPYDPHKPRTPAA